MVLFACSLIPSRFEQAFASIGWNAITFAWRSIEITNLVSLTIYRRQKGRRKV